MALGCENKAVLDSNEDKMVEVSFSLGGEVTTEDSSLGQTRAGETDSNDLIGIQVYEGTTPYAYGLFDNISGQTIYLHSGKTYKFECTKIVNGKSLLKKLDMGHSYSVSYAGKIYYDDFYSDQPDVPTCGFGYPFHVDSNRGYLHLSEPSNMFTYFSTAYFVSLSEVECALSTSESRVYYPELYRYYGEASNFTPSANSTVTINMKQTGFGLKYVVQGVTDGSASITIKNDKRTFFTKSDIASSFTSNGLFFQFEDVKGAWQYADDYSENVTVSMSWLRGVGVNQDLGSQVVQVKRNKLNIINISLSTSTRSSEISNVDEPKVTIHVTYE